MPHYFFHLHNDIDAHDDEGCDHEDDLAAIDYAIECARDLASVSVRAGHLNLEDCIIVEDEDGREIRRVKFADAVHIAP